MKDSPEFKHWFLVHLGRNLDKLEPYEADLDSYRIKRMKEIAKEYSELIAHARRDTTKDSLRERALQAIEDVQMVDDFLDKLGMR